MRRTAFRWMVAFGVMACVDGAAAQTLSPGAKIMYDEMIRDTAGARTACRGGAPGLQSYVGQKYARVVQDPRKAMVVDGNKDLLPAVEAFSKRCPEFMR